MRTSDVIPSGIAVVDSRKLGRCTNTHRRNPAQRALGFGSTLIITKYASRRLPMQTNLNTAQENQKNENTRRMDVQPYIYMSGKSPGKMSRQTNRSVQTHYFKFKHQIKPPVTQYATTRPLYPASALSTGFYHNYSPLLAIRPRSCIISSTREQCLMSWAYIFLMLVCLA